MVRSLRLACLYADAGFSVYVWRHRGECLWWEGGVPRLRVFVGGGQPEGVLMPELRRAAGGEEGRPRGWSELPRDSLSVKLIGTNSGGDEFTLETFPNQSDLAGEPDPNLTSSTL